MIQQPVTAAVNPPDGDLVAVLQSARSQSPDQTLQIVTGLLQTYPQSPTLLGCAGALSLQMNDAASAIGMLRAATTLDPADPAHWRNLGVAAKMLGLAAESESAFRRAIQLAPNDAEGWYNLGNLYLDWRQPRAAMEQFLKAIDIKPDHADALNNLGTALLETRHLDSAAEAFRLAAVARPQYQAALTNLAQTFAMMSRPADAATQARKALEIGPHDACERLLCLQSAMVADWSAHARFATLPVVAPMGQPPAPPFSALAFDDDPARALARSRAYAAAQMAPARPFTPPPPAADGRLRIGYFSCDFHDHATMYLMAGLLREHDRSRFAIHAFSYGGNAQDTMRAQAMASVEHFHDLAEASDADAAACILQHNIDILVDLKGFTQGTRTALLGARLAPVQVAWLGYPGPIGHSAIDYAIADHVVLPPELRPHFDENVVWLAGSYQCNDNARPIIPDSGTRADHGLPDKGFVFCSFNATYKIGPAEFDIWMDLLRKVEGSVLWLLASHPEARTALAREAAARGVDPARLVFADSLPHHQYLGRMAHADLFLDSFAVNAHTTCSDALWAGVPVVTLAGRSFAARVGASLLTAIGLADMVAHSRADYAALALDIALDPMRKADVLARLAQGRAQSSLFDSAAFARKIEAAYTAMAARARAGLLPDDIDLA